jgi:folylpolyglutamate synthase/dihydropteroate synthase
LVSPFYIQKKSGAARYVCEIFTRGDIFTGSAKKLSVSYRFVLNHDLCPGAKEGQSQHTIPEIASQKAGIIKTTNKACISQKQVPQAHEVISAKAQEHKVPLFEAGDGYFIHDSVVSAEGSVFNFKDSKHELKNLSMPLLGSHQIKNAAAAIKALIELSSFGISFNEDTVRHVLSTAHFAGRFEHFTQDNHEWILDGAHNEDKLTAFLNSLKTLFPAQQKIAIIGFKRDKDIATCLKLIIPHFTTIICTQAKALTDIGSNMATSPQELQEKLKELDQMNGFFKYTFIHTIIFFHPFKRLWIYNFKSTINFITTIFKMIEHHMCRI